ncbi:MAG: hypothetical protein H3C64_04770, partial [Candidatus Kuenenia stuttgartiensis]|nr:hypothetical protein [Candidatus Kuenenia stuttgartiensis]
KLDSQKKDKQIRKEIADLLKHSGWDTSTAEKIATFDLYDQNASADWFDPEWMFGIVVETGFKAVSTINANDQPPACVYHRNGNKQW